jgi:RNA polymerase sigma-70 factor (ECF subfamily)
MATTLDTDPRSDAEIARIVACRDSSLKAMIEVQDAFAVLYRRHAGKLLAFLSTRVSRSDLDDVHQEIWLRVWSNLPEGFDGRDFRAWLFTITRHYLVDRSRKRRQESLEDHVENLADRSGDEPDARLIDEERKAALERCLEKLTDRSRTLVQCRMGGEDYPSICQRLGISEERAYRVFNKAKQQLKTCLERAMK